MEPVNGTEGNDTLVGSGGNDTLLGLGGNDLLAGGDGNDSLRGGDGDDELRGEAGDDELWGDEGNDTLTGADGQDALFGGAGDDVLDGGTDTGWPGFSLVPWINGGPGNDVLDNGLLHFEWSPEYTALQGVIVNLSTSARTVDGITIGARTAHDEFGDTDQLGDGIVNGHATVLDDVWIAPETWHYVFLRGGNDRYYGASAGGNVLPGSGDDTIIGGSGAMMVSYADTEYDLDGLVIQGVVADLASGVVHDGWGGIDSLSGEIDLYGGTRADRITGNTGDNHLGGAAGNDTLAGAGGNDFLAGDAGTDTAVFAGNAADYTISYDGTYYRVVDSNPADGNDGTDTLHYVELARFADREIVLGGNPANDELIDLTGPGGGTAEGGRGNDTYLVDDPLDNPVEAPGQGIDTVRASLSWTLGANLENLVLLGDADLDGTGNAAANTLTGNAGRNRLDGGAGADTLIGGAGGDTYVVDDPLDLVIEEVVATASRAPVAATTRFAASALPRDEVDGRDPQDAGDDADTLVSLVGRAYLGAFVESGVLAEGSVARELIGNLLDNTGSGNKAANLLQGAGGNDTLSGSDGLDVAAFAGQRADYAISVGADTVQVTDQNHADGDEGTDTLAGFELLRFADGVLALPGTALQEGSGDAETLDLTAPGGQAAAGGSGDDIYLADSTDDAAIEYQDGGNDSVQSSASWTLWEYIEHLVLTGSAAIDGAGNSGNNSLGGNSAVNTLWGYGGNDTLRGGAGADVLVGGAGNDLYIVNGKDTITEAAGGGSDTVQSASDWTLAGNLEKLLLTGTRAVSGTGNAGPNTLIGNRAANTLAGMGGTDTLLGQAGSDVLNGGPGADRLSGGPGADAFVFDSPLNAAANRDTLTDFRPGVDRIQLDSEVFSALATGALPEAAFRAGAGTPVAGDADDRILYDTTTGALYYDADGSGAIAAMQFAILGTTAHPTISAADFLIVP